MRNLPEGFEETVNLFLKRLVKYLLASEPFPILNPYPTKRALPIKDEHRPVERRFVHPVH
jgi:hypothetical protein